MGGLAGEVHLMPPASVSLLLSAMTIYANSLATDTSVTENVVIGGGFVVISLAIVNTISTGLADVFALLLFIVIFLKYGLTILTAIGVAQTGTSDGTT
jgi:hypothetical protein